MILTKGVVSIKCVKRGEIYYILPSPAVGHEQAGKRPAIIISNNLGNIYSPVVEIIFITTKCKKSLPTHVVIYSSKRKSIALCEQVTTIDKSRILNYIGKVTEDELEKINQAIKISLGMEETNMSKKNELTVTEYKDIRVLTTQQLAEKYGTNSDIITRNFNRNKDRYIEEKHYIALEGTEKNNFLNQGQFDRGLKNAKTLYLWTEKGAFLHAKSLNTDRAWEVYDRLVDSYFQKPQKQLSDREIMRIQLDMYDEHEERIVKLENTMNIDYGQQQELKKAVNATVIKALGGKCSNAYKEISKKVFSECNRDIQEYFHVNSRNNIPRVKYYEAIKYVNTWQPCNNTKIAIKDCNNQLNIA